MVTVIRALLALPPQMLAKHLQVTVPLLVLTAPSVTLVWLLLEHVLHARLVVTSVVALAKHVLSQMEIVMSAILQHLLNVSPALLVTHSQLTLCLAFKILPLAKPQI